MKLQAILLLTYGAANALLYSSMLPLWEGFDEPFHFGYVQYLANGYGLPDPRTAFLSQEIGSSILIAPASQVVQVNLPEVKTYSEYFSFPSNQRAALRKQLDEIRPEGRRQNSHFLNYEAHHAPFAYLLLALPERALAGVSLPRRVLVLQSNRGIRRGSFALRGSRNSVPGAWHPRAVQLRCHLLRVFVSDDLGYDSARRKRLAFGPARGLVIGIDDSLLEKPQSRTGLLMAGVLSLGLLTKAYFIAFVPMVFILCLTNKRIQDLMLITAVLLAAAGPWYTRNILRYGSLTGMQESRAGIGVAAAIHSAPLLNWPRVIQTSVRAALWTGNNSFMAFSGVTLAAIVAIWLISLVFWARAVTPARNGSPFCTARYSRPLWDTTP